MKRIYLDNNATSPVTSNIWSKMMLLKEFANPASMHVSGKESRKIINDAKNFLYREFNLSPEDYEIFFHSGVTEGLNTFFNLHPGDCFFYGPTDHAAVLAIADHLKTVGVGVHSLVLRKDGGLDLEKSLQVIEQFGSSRGENWLNYTVVNNESGVVFPLEDIIELKSKISISVHVDGAQFIGRTDRGLKLVSGPDAYSFSGHKFGALKGIGFSFYKKELKLAPFIHGGGQQVSMRSGTENLHGIVSLKYALENRDFIAEYNQISELKIELEKIFSSNSNIKILKNQSANTIFLYHEKLKSDLLFILFDSNGLDVSVGSACSAGSFEPSRSLVAMGLEKYAKNTLRISLGMENISDSDEIKARLRLIIQKL